MTNQELSKENALLKQRIQELEKSEAGFKRAERPLQENEQKYRVLFEAASDGIFIHGATGFIDCNS